MRPRIRIGRAATGRHALRGTLAAVALLVSFAGHVAPSSAAVSRQPPPAALEWHPCDGAYQCATATVPLDYRRPRGRTIDLALIRHEATDPTARLGSLFVNPGGPGGSGVDLVRAQALRGLAPLNKHFDLIGFDPRGVGASQPAVRCLDDDEAKAQFSAPLLRPDGVSLSDAVAWSRAWVNRCVERNSPILPFLSTANVARDLDRLRAAVGDDTLTYVGFSYGTLIGATYAALFPEHVRALVLDGPVDPDVWLNSPLEATQDQLAGFERALHRFFVACARGTWCDYGGDDPEQAFDDLVAQLDQHPVFADPPYDSRPVTGDTALVAAAYAMDSKPLWPLLGGGLEQAQEGRGTALRALDDLYWGIDVDGAYDGVWDRNLAISALDQRYPRSLAAYVADARHSDAMFPDFGWSSGYFELPWGLYPVRARGVYRGPFRLPSSRPPALVIGTTYDPSTPYPWARRLTAELGNARLLTMVGDGHTAFLNHSSCVVGAVVQYVERLLPPAEGTRCSQDLAAIASRRAAMVPLGRSLRDWKLRALRLATVR